MPGQARHCPRCGRPAEPLQEICIECGEPLPHRQRPGGWLLPSAAALGVAAAAAAVVLAIGKGDGARSIVAPPLTASTAGTTSPPGATAPSVTPAGSTVTTAGTTDAAAPAATTRPPGATTGAATTSASTRAQGGPALTVWPAGRDGFTVVLASLPQAAGAGSARARALDAAQRGLPRTGVLVSDGFASLHPGYYVVFSGSYATLGEAQRAAAAAQSRFPGAYPRRIAR